MTRRGARTIRVHRALRDRAALDLHLAMPHMAAWMKAAGPKLKAARGFLYDV